MKNDNTKKRSFLARCGCIFSIGAILAAALPAPAATSIEADWENPPQTAKVRAYWWWLNGNVTKEAITRDLEAMKEKGFGGAVIFDADGAAQFGNSSVPAGPMFGSPEWRGLFQHALQEAKRLGLTLSLNIQSGWNPGGPSVKASDAAKITVWSETTVSGPGKITRKLPEPKHRDAYYEDEFVLAWPLAEGSAPPDITASGAQKNHPAALAGDGQKKTFWVSDGKKAGDGPTAENPVFLQLAFETGKAATALEITPRDGFGPKSGRLQVSADGKKFTDVSDFSAKQNGSSRVDFSAAKGRVFRLLITGSYDPSQAAGKSRNVQIAELNLIGKDGPLNRTRPPLVSLTDKALLSTMPGSAPELSRLLDHKAAEKGENFTPAGQVIDLSEKMAENGSLSWRVPEGKWKVMRFGATVGPRAHVSTSSGKWQGYAMDMFDAGAFERYWDAVVKPLIDEAGPLAGKTLKYLHSDSMEIEPVNWTPTLPAEFEKRRGYALYPWLPVFAGAIIESRAASTRFLADFRLTLGELSYENHYLLFKEKAHARGLEIHPEAGGPHVVPIDAQKNLGNSDVPMSEFWANSWKHRVGDPNRFFVKQPASAAHTYGRPLVMAEGFTTVGPHWQERLWNNLKPTFDMAITEGLNSLVWHAWVCSPKEMGMPGQQYFAGTHLNPNVTWWAEGKPFFDYLNRTQAMMQRGLPASDVLYYYGAEVPNYTQLRDADPAGVGRGYDYDVITAQALLARVSVKDGQLVLPEGTSYKMLMLPDLDEMPIKVLRKVHELVQAGAKVAGPAPNGLPGCSIPCRKRMTSPPWPPIFGAEVKASFRPPKPAKR